MKWSQRFFTLGLALALTAGVSCTTGDGPTGVSSTQPVEQFSAQQIEQPSHLLGGVLNGVGGIVGGTVGGVVDLAGGVVGGLLEITGLLSCEEQKYDVTYQTVGPRGGSIKVGKHSLTIPKGALRYNVRIKAEQMPGSTNSVRFSPEGLEFEKPATLTLDYKNCEDVGTPKAVVYTTEEFKILEVLQSLDLFKRRTVTAPIDHFSRYAIAW
jgi:hypothetical protein